MLTISAGAGTAAITATAATTLPTQTQLIAGNSITLTAGNSVSIADSVRVETLEDADNNPATDPTVSPGGVVSITAVQNVVLGLEGFGAESPSSPARRQVAQITAGDRIAVTYTEALAIEMAEKPAKQ